jgi:hypothetical protein
LVNEESISRSEFYCYGLNGKVVTVGKQTAENMGIMRHFEYIGGYRTAISGNRYCTQMEQKPKKRTIDIEITTIKRTNRRS